MSASHAERHGLYESLEPIIGEQSANLLMNLLPAHPDTELVTRTDMHANTNMLHGEMAELRGDLRSETAELRSELRGEMADLRVDLRGEMAELRVGLRTEMADLRTDLTGRMVELRSDLLSEMSERFERNQQWMVALAFANFVATLGVAAAVVAALVV